MAMLLPSLTSASSSPTLVQARHHLDLIFRDLMSPCAINPFLSASWFRTRLSVAQIVIPRSASTVDKAEGAPQDQSRLQISFESSREVPSSKGCWQTGLGAPHPVLGR